MHIFTPSRIVYQISLRTKPFRLFYNIISPNISSRWNMLARYNNLRRWRWCDEMKAAATFLPRKSNPTTNSFTTLFQGFCNQVVRPWRLPIRTIKTMTLDHGGKRHFNIELQASLGTLGFYEKVHKSHHA